ncbi:hypothetical protein L6452_05651 [Arctium lappa]|uniref:Uncharacterized protein n=1 Tax=Arctium lappa TaxID=4217 RepID=A0ACB9EHN4_ARCLA|nr:hypothetical protein L6452_05651 [Arctium lappa]
MKHGLQSILFSPPLWFSPGHAIHSPFLLLSPISFFLYNTPIPFHPLLTINPTPFPFLFTLPFSFFIHDDDQNRQRAC